MKKKLSLILALLTAAALLTGCNNSNTPSSGTQSGSGSSSGSSRTSGMYSSSGFSSGSSLSSDSSTSESSSESSSSDTPQDSSPKSSAVSSSSKPYSSGKPVSSTPHGDSAMEVIPEAEQTKRVSGDRISFRAENIYSQGKTYSVVISGVKMLNQSAGVSIDTTLIDGVLYGDFRLDLYSSAGELIDTLKINVPSNDSFLILENAAIGKDYGYTLMSHKETFKQESYPDMLRLDFFRQRGMAVPQYARYFAVFSDKIEEVRFFENGKEVAPIGTFAQMRGNGLMTQNLTVENGKGGYTVIKYEYRFDVEKRRLNRTQVRFTGWED